MSKVEHEQIPDQVWWHNSLSRSLLLTSAPDAGRNKHSGVILFTYSICLF